MGIAVGIDLGSTKTLVAVAQAPGEPARVLPNERGEEGTPAVIAEDDDGTIIVGRRAIDRRTGGAITFAKRYLGKDKTFDLPHAGSLRPADAVSLQLADARHTAERQLDEVVDSAVIGVPVHWDCAVISEFRDAATRAGFNRVTLIPEPVAAVMACDIGDDRPRRVLTYDLGGGKFEAAVVEVRDGQCTVVASDGDENIGGYDFDVRLARWLWERFRADGYDHLHDPEWPEPQQVWTRSLLLAEQAKISLSDELNAELRARVAVQDRPGHISFPSVLIRRGKFEELIVPDVDRTLELCRQLLARACLTPDDLDDVLLLGGSSKIPLVRQKFSAEFPHEPRLVAPLHSVALGAARAAARRTEWVEMPRQEQVNLNPPVAADRAAHVQDLDEIASRSRKLAAQGDFRRARDAILEIPAASDDAAMLKHELLRQLDEIQTRYTKGLVDNALSDAYRFADRGDFENAIAIISRLPNEPEELVRLKDDLRRELSHRNHELQKHVVEIKRQFATLVRSGQFHKAREFLAQFSDQPQCVAELIRGLSRDLDDREAARTTDLKEWPHRLWRKLRDTLSFNPPRPARGGRAGTPEFPGSDVDYVHFSVTSPTCVQPGTTFILDVWAHLEQQRQLVLERAQQALGGHDVLLRSKGPVEVARGTTLTVGLSIDGLEVPDPHDTILWKGDIGNAQFMVKVPLEFAPTDCAGMAGIYINGLRIAKLHFTIPVAAHVGPTESIPSTVDRHQRAFASYASEDRDQVLGRVQGMQKRSPSLDVFLDVLKLRSGQDWKEALKREIDRCDVFYLFWSEHARKSEWVDWEWHCALKCPGFDCIDPVPLIDPKHVPPPPELASKHFNDWVLAFMRGR